MTLETKDLVISEELKRKVEMVCRFANVKYTIINGNIKSIKNTNIVHSFCYTFYRFRRYNMKEINKLSEA